VGDSGGDSADAHGSQRYPRDTLLEYGRMDFAFHVGGLARSHGGLFLCDNSQGAKRIGSYAITDKLSLLCAVVYCFGIGVDLWAWPCQEVFPPTNDHFQRHLYGCTRDVGPGCYWNVRVLPFG